MTMTNASNCGFLKFRSLAIAGLCLVPVALSACTPPDQRLFDPNAGKPPKPYIPPAPPAKPAPAPFLQIVAGTPKEEWVPAVTRSTKLALSRKPDLLFVVTVLSPVTESPAAQVKSLETLTAQDGKDVAEQIVASGAPASQVQIEARTDASSPKGRIRIDLR
ncbi:hypothetical protein ACFFGF_09320 [Asaia lannensis]|uniref:Lipoprotein n=1 Tax=Asaia lannensis NBRC 102526 TaxID=1307926 RepID=A0ABT1CJX2_9PROT|nr:hypothetical protein [Asaia lannensis]MCO6160498.1 hypothetical protein [Asaia lannensis NBRC 102526]